MTGVRLAVCKCTAGEASPMALEVKPCEFRLESCILATPEAWAGCWYGSQASEGRQQVGTQVAGINKCQYMLGENS